MDKFTLNNFLNSKLFNDLEINDLIKEKIEQLINEFDKKIIRNNYIIIRNFIIYEVPGNWNERFYNIKNKFNRDSSSLDSYVERFGDIIGKEKFNDKINKSTVTLESLIKKHGKVEGENLHNQLCKKKRSVGKEIMQNKYGDSEGLIRWEKYLQKWHKGIKERKEQKKWNNGLSLEETIIKYGEIDGKIIWENRQKHQKYISSKKYFIDTYGNEIGQKKWEEFCKKRDYTSLKYFTKKYGEIDGYNKYKERCKLISYYNSLEYYILKYGEEEGKRRKENAVIKSFLNHKFKITRYSKISQELFWEIYNNLDSKMQKNCYFAELNSEFMFYVHSEDIKVFFVDFKIGNKIIEFNGDYWHSLEEVVKRDEQKKEFLFNKKYELLEIKESDYIKDKSKTIKKVLTFINQK